MRDESAREIFGYVHEFVDDCTDFIIVGKLVEVMSENLNNIVGRVGKRFLPDFWEAPDARIRAAGGTRTSHTGYLS